MTSLLDCGNMLPLSSTRHVASDQSADVSAHSKSASRMQQGQRGALARRRKLGDDGNQMKADGNSFPVFILGWTTEVGVELACSMKRLAPAFVLHLLQFDLIPLYIVEIED